MSPNISYLQYSMYYLTNEIRNSKIKKGKFLFDSIVIILHVSIYVSQEIQSALESVGLLTSMFHYGNNYARFSFILPYFLSHFWQCLTSLCTACNFVYFSAVFLFCIQHSHNT